MITLGRKKSRGPMSARPLCRGAICFACLFVLMGCAHFKQVQYFEAAYKDPLTGKEEISYYRATIQGHGISTQKYTMRGAYMSTAAIDVLDNENPEVPIIDRSLQNEEAFGNIKASFLGALEAYASQTAKGAKDPSPLNTQEEQLVAIARQAWFANLSDQDLISVGMLRDTDPYKFRKLVFYVSKKDIDMTAPEYGGQVDSILGNITTIAESMRAKRDAQRAEEKKREDGLNTAILEAVEPMATDDARKTAMKIIRALLGLEAESESNGD